MRVVLDTNIIVSGFIVVPSMPASILELWLEGEFILLSCEDQIEEIRRVTRRPHIKRRIRAALAGKFVNEMRKTATLVNDAADVEVSPDPWDNYLLALAKTGQADFLVTGDKTDLLSMERFGTARIVTARQFLDGL